MPVGVFCAFLGSFRLVRYLPAFLGHARTQDDFVRNKENRGRSTPCGMAIPGFRMSMTLKKAKLRHAEYYDFQETQDRLYAESAKGREFKHLMEIISRPENIRLAYRNIKTNPGSKTAGTDGRTIKDLSKLSAEELVNLVQRKLDWYEPQSIRRVEIPKDNDPGKTRPLGIPTVTS